MELAGSYTVGLREYNTGRYLSMLKFAGCPIEIHKYAQAEVLDGWILTERVDLFNDKVIFEWYRK